jgi:hypothetical protein
MAMKATLKYVAATVMMATSILSVVSIEATGAASVASCAASNLRLGVGPLVSLVAGERAMVFTLTNSSAMTCQVSGYPKVSLLDVKGQAIAFRYTTSTSPYLTTAAPKTVIIFPKSRAYFMVAKYRCDLGNARTAISAAVRLPGASAQSTALKLSVQRIRTLAYCKGKVSNPGQLVGISPFTATALATLAGAPSVHGALAACTSINNWPTKPVTTAVVNAVTKYYAAKKLTPVTIDKNREWILNVVAQRVGVHWCLNPDGSASGYVGAVPLNATAAVMVYAHHKPYPVVQAPSHFVTVAYIAGVWKVVAEGTGP